MEGEGRGGGEAISPRFDCMYCSNSTTTRIDIPMGFDRWGCGILRNGRQLGRFVVYDGCVGGSGRFVVSELGVIVLMSMNDDDDDGVSPGWCAPNLYRNV